MLTSVTAATLVEVLLAALALAGIGFAVASALPVADADADEPPFPLPEGTVTPEAVDRARFPLAFRGYRMAEVDEVLERVAQALAERDAEIARLRPPVTEQVTDEPAPAAVPDDDSPNVVTLDWQEFGVTRENEA